MALPLFVVIIIADSEGVLCVFSGSDSRYLLLLVTTRLKNIPRPLLPYKCYTHTKTRNWVSRDPGTDFGNFFWKQTFKI
jgi:hypothetical protein